MRTEHLHLSEDQIEWGLYAGPVDLLATIKSVTIEGAIEAFRKLPEHVRGRMEPSNQNVRPLR